MKSRKAERELIACPRCYTGTLKDAKVIAYCQPCQKAMKELNQPTPAAHTPMPHEIVAKKKGVIIINAERTQDIGGYENLSFDDIVRAVASHEALLECLKWTQGMTTEEGWKTFDVWAKKVISQAEGK